MLTLTNSQCPSHCFIHSFARQNLCHGVLCQVMWFGLVRLINKQAHFLCDHNKMYLCKLLCFAFTVNFLSYTALNCF